ncbi:hypothetical protein [Tautonia plasticadhaerens]|uniref:Uncharacterized protein n=1 Tax=Tautonia plasticadhaerens TaxID=2527974 RepID=A0A518HFS1_9BACT|nr:hypothetical protein [Tautonia plasticadhaerens]QDV39681.1 hypothetical protein ElP_76530 [Tautonia plasticadhaerens]
MLAAERPIKSPTHVQVQDLMLNILYPVPPDGWHVAFGFPRVLGRTTCRM